MFDATKTPTFEFNCASQWCRNLQNRIHRMHAEGSQFDSQNNNTSRNRSRTRSPSNTPQNNRTARPRVFKEDTHPAGSQTKKPLQMRKSYYNSRSQNKPGRCERPKSKSTGLPRGNTSINMYYRRQNYPNQNPGSNYSTTQIIIILKPIILNQKPTINTPKTTGKTTTPKTRAMLRERTSLRVASTRIITNKMANTLMR